MRYATRLSWVSLWLGTLTTWVILFAFAFSMRRAVGWVSPDARYEVSLALGGMSFAWGWRAGESPYPRHPGWWVAWYATAPPLANMYWSPSGGTDRTSTHFAIVPLWIPFILLALPTGVFWYRKRRSVAHAFSWSLRRLTPRRPTRVRFWLIAAFLAIHLVTLVPTVELCCRLYSFFVQNPSGRTFEHVALPIFAALFFGAPLWAVLWAWLWVRFRNRLFRLHAGDRCLNCGYDLTGNVSGRCPECGAPLRAAVGGC